MGIKSIASKISLARASSNTILRPLSLPLDIQDKSLLVLLPSIQRDLMIVKQVLPEIQAYFGDRNVFLLASPDTNVLSIFPSKGFNILSPGKSDTNWCDLPSSSFIEKLRSYNFDYIFDTNLEENRYAAKILLGFPQAIRFGANGRLGLPYLNLEVKTKYLRDRRLIYHSILEVVANLTKTPKPISKVSKE
ncbi:MAG: hypothetical protein ABIE07_07210 [Candidatus Zixiibacteriota bacterium]